MREIKDFTKDNFDDAIINQLNYHLVLVAIFKALTLKSNMIKFSKNLYFLFDVMCILPMLSIYPDKTYVMENEIKLLYKYTTSYKLVSLIYIHKNLPLQETLQYSYIYIIIHHTYCNVTKFLYHSKSFVYVVYFSSVSLGSLYNFL